MHPAMQRAMAEPTGTMTLCQTLTPYIQPYLMLSIQPYLMPFIQLYLMPTTANLISMRHKKTTEKTPMTMLVELIISLSTLLHLHATHKDIAHHQSLLSNPYPTCTPAILLVVRAPSGSISLLVPRAQLSCIFLPVVKDQSNPNHTPVRAWCSCICLLIAWAQCSCIFLLIARTQCSCIFLPVIKDWPHPLTLGWCLFLPGRTS